MRPGVLVDIRRRRDRTAAEHRRQRLQRDSRERQRRGASETRLAARTRDGNHRGDLARKPVSESAGILLGVGPRDLRSRDSRAQPRSCAEHASDRGDLWTVKRSGPPSVGS